jgi:hypothetical protein
MTTVISYSRSYFQWLISPTPVGYAVLKSNFSPLEKANSPPKAWSPPAETSTNTTTTTASSVTHRGELLNDFTLWNEFNQKFRMSQVGAPVPLQIGQWTLSRLWVGLSYTPLDHCDNGDLFVIWNGCPFMIAGLSSLFFVLVGETFSLGISELGIPGEGPRLQFPPLLNGTECRNTGHSNIYLLSSLE